MTAFSRGPWRAVPRDSNSGFVIRIDEDLPIAIVPVNRRGRDVAEANARLIAAAPDMLAALMKISVNLSSLSQSGDDIYAAMVRRVDAAINKAMAEQDQVETKATSGVAS